MTNLNKTDNTDTLNEAMHAVLASMANVTDHSSEEYAKMVDQLVKIHKMKEDEEDRLLKQQEIDSNNLHKEKEHDLKQQDLDNFNRLSLTTIATIAANIIGIVIVMNHERAAVITSKAFGMLSKLK